MNVIKFIPKKFGCISTCLDAHESSAPISSQLEVVQSWLPCAEKIRVFGSYIPNIKGVSSVKTKDQNPTLRAVLQDYHLALRSQSPLILTTPDVKLNPVCEQIVGYAEKKRMGIAWMGYAGTANIAAVFCLSPSVARTLLQEVPDEVVFNNPEWRGWLFGWMKKYMMPHRIFDASPLGLIATEPPVVAPEVIAQSKPIKKKHPKPSKNEA